MGKIGTFFDIAVIICNKSLDLSVATQVVFYSTTYKEL